MGTSAIIILEKENNQGFDAVSVNYDGYLNHTGRMLLQHYNSVEKVQELIQLGDLSFLDQTLQESIFYHRDRNESWYNNNPRQSSRLHDLTMFDYSWAYLMDRDGTWKVAHVGMGQDSFELLTSKHTDE